jgi:NAD(P)-dependent dehydrogenase (short-subunit alcohol dehydrogenase family)
MTTRRFTMDDQLGFAALSGDRNPLHLEPVARRSLLGGVAVHGIHLLLWALDALAEERILRGFARLRVHFDRGVVVGDTVLLSWREEETRLVCRLTGNLGTLVRINLTPAETDVAPWSGATEIPLLACEEHEMPTLDGRTGELELALPQNWEVMFPNLAEKFSPALIASLLATSRLVGMVCPGLHSIFSALHLGWEQAAAPGSTLRYKVIRADPRVRLVDMMVAADGVVGTVSALLRPKPYGQPRLAELRKMVPADAFAGQEALVIGGSRGLGELAAKLLAVGGAHVTLTWYLGEAEASAIVREATSLGLTMRARHFDVATPPQDVKPIPAPYTHMYYFATPRIPAGQPGQFHPEMFATLLDVYVAGLARCATWLASHGVPDVCVWYPSTVFINQPDPHFTEYTAAKACGEALCSQLAEQLTPMRVVAERLPRLPTDQTQALTEGSMADGVATLLAALLRGSRLC